MISVMIVCSRLRMMGKRLSIAICGCDSLCVMFSMSCWIVVSVLRVCAAVVLGCCRGDLCGRGCMMGESVGWRSCALEGGIKVGLVCCGDVGSLYLCCWTCCRATCCVCGVVCWWNVRVGCE